MSNYCTSIDIRERGLSLWLSCITRWLTRGWDVTRVHGHSNGQLATTRYSYPPPPVSFPTPCRSRGGGGGPSLGQPKIFRCGSLCCCVGGCVVGHCHLQPLHSWQDILLTFTEMELDNTTMFPLGTSVMFIRSTGEPVLAQVVGHS